jgi:hypothetical protein
MKICKHFEGCYANIQAIYCRELLAVHVAYLPGFPFNPAHSGVASCL